MQLFSYIYILNLQRLQNHDQHSSELFTILSSFTLASASKRTALKARDAATRLFIVSAGPHNEIDPNSNKKAVKWHAMGVQCAGIAMPMFRNP